MRYHVKKFSFKFTEKNEDGAYELPEGWEPFQTAMVNGIVYIWASKKV
jgi:hypothetical protein